MEYFVMFACLVTVFLLGIRVGKTLFVLKTEDSNGVIFVDTSENPPIMYLALSDEADIVNNRKLFITLRLIYDNSAK